MMKIGIIGKACSGKTTVANYFVKQCIHSTILKFAEPHYEILNVLHQDKNRLFMQEFSSLAKKHFGNTIFTKLFKQKYFDQIKKNNISVIICDDARYSHEVEVLQDLGFSLIFVKTRDSVRQQRSEQAGLVFNDNHDSESGVSRLENCCHYHIYNNHTLADFHAQLDVVYDGIIS